MSFVAHTLRKRDIFQGNIKIDHFEGLKGLLKHPFRVILGQNVSSVTTIKIALYITFRRQPKWFVFSNVRFQK